MPEGCFDLERNTGVYLDPIRVDREGNVHAPTKPGLGSELDLATAERLASEAR